MKINWNTTEDRVNKFLATCNSLARKFDVFDIECPDDVYEFLKNNPKECENFIIKECDYYYIVGKNNELVDKHIRNR